MRIVIPFVALLFLGAAAAAEIPSATTQAPALAPNSTVEAGPLVRFDRGVPASDESRSCRDRIQTAREERGLPILERKTASPEEPLFIAAVDKRIDCCSVLVMRNNTSDIRPLPTVEGDGKLTPAR